VKEGDLFEAGGEGFVIERSRVLRALPLAWSSLREDRIGLRGSGEDVRLFNFHDNDATPAIESYLVDDGKTGG
jgi:hypothetical protein